MHLSQRTWRNELSHLEEVVTEPHPNPIVTLANPLLQPFGETEIPLPDIQLIGDPDSDPLGVSQFMIEHETSFCSSPDTLTQSSDITDVKTCKSKGSRGSQLIGSLGPLSSDSMSEDLKILNGHLPEVVVSKILATMANPLPMKLTLVLVYQQSLTYQAQVQRLKKHPSKSSKFTVED